MTKTQDWEGWPRPCPGGCGRLMREPHAKAGDYPDLVTRAAVNSTGYCTLCAGRGGAHRSRTPKPTEGEEAKLRRMRSEIESLVADRRRRGVPPEGVLMPGETPEIPKRQRPLPLKDSFTDPDAPLGYCGRGHPFDRFDSAGRRYCVTCNEFKNKRAREGTEKKLAAERGQALTKNDRGPSPDAPHGRCMLGHPYKGTNGQKKKQRYCPTCKKQGQVARQLRALRKERLAA